MLELLGDKYRHFMFLKLKTYVIIAVLVPLFKVLFLAVHHCHNVLDIRRYF
jgi:hypothetical protein